MKMTKRMLLLVFMVITVSCLASVAFAALTDSHQQAAVTQGVENIAIEDNPAS